MVPQPRPLGAQHSIMGSIAQLCAPLTSPYKHLAVLRIAGLLFAFWSRGER